MDPRADELTNSEVTLGEACAGALTGVKDRSTAQHGTRCFCLRTRNLVALFGRERKAVAAVEFALVGLVGLELLVEIMQAGTYFYTSAGVERATSKAVRQILTGAVNSAGYTATQFRANVLCPAISGTNLSCGNVITNIQTVSEAPSPGGFYALLNSSQTGLLRPPLDNSQTTYCTGTSQSYVFVQILSALYGACGLRHTTVVLATSYNPRLPSETNRSLPARRAADGHAATRQSAHLYQRSPCRLGNRIRDMGAVHVLPVLGKRRHHSLRRGDRKAFGRCRHNGANAVRQYDGYGKLLRSSILPRLGNDNISASPYRRCAAEQVVVERHGHHHDQHYVHGHTFWVHELMLICSQSGMDHRNEQAPLHSEQRDHRTHHLGERYVFSFGQHASGGQLRPDVPTCCRHRLHVPSVVRRSAPSRPTCPQQHQHRPLILHVATLRAIGWLSINFRRSRIDNGMSLRLTQCP